MMKKMILPIASAIVVRVVSLVVFVALGAFVAVVLHWHVSSVALLIVAMVLH